MLNKLFGKFMGNKIKDNTKPGVLTYNQLSKFLPNTDRATIEYYLPALNKVLPEYDITTRNRICHFLAQIAHESAGFTKVKENLNYSEKRLLEVFPSRVSESQAKEIAGKAQEIANVLYGGRMGNTAENDGWKYRGRGLIQLTGKNNYKACSKDTGLDLVNNPDLVNSDPYVCVEVACWYWDSRTLNYAADQDDIKTITKRINGGYNGLSHRERLLKDARRALSECEV